MGYIVFILFFYSVLNINLKNKFVNQINNIIIPFYLIYLAANFENNVDRQNYEENIFYISRFTYENSILEIFTNNRLEPTFIAIAAIVRLFTDENIAIYLIYAYWGFYFKFKYFNTYEKYGLFMFATYLVSFALTLEFAAIRIAAALGFLVLNYYYEDKNSNRIKNLYLLIGILIHYSIIIIPIFNFLYNRIEFLKRNKSILFVVILFLSQILFNLFSEFNRISNYDGNYGTYYGLIFPIAFLLIVIYYYYNFSNTLLKDSSINKTYFSIICISAISIGLNFKFVILSYRLLEIEQFIFLIVLFKTLKHSNNSRQLFNWIIIYACQFMLIQAKLIYLKQWQIMFQ